MALEEQTSRLTWLECPFRIIRPATQAKSFASGREIVICEAGGGITLTAVVEKGVSPVCRSCDIPQSLLKKHACLYLVPFEFPGSMMCKAITPADGFSTSPQAISPGITIGAGLVLIGFHDHRNI